LMLMLLLGAVNMAAWRQPKHRDIHGGGFVGVADGLAGRGHGLDLMVMPAFFGAALRAVLGLCFV